jgi:hypothetical protein
MRLAIDGIMASMVIGAWTAFETLAGDLWENALNTSPKLGIRALDAEPSPNDDEATTQAKRKRKITFPARLLYKYHFSIKHRMGTILREKWKFTRRKEADEAYTKVFGETPIFRDQNLRWLSALRNVLVGSGGELCWSNPRARLFDDMRPESDVPD